MTQPANTGRWVRDAACADYDTNAFAIPDQRRPGRPGPTAGSHLIIRAAKQTCQRCPVLAECRAWALSTPDPAVGLIAGGLTPRERASKRRDGAA